MIKPRLISRRQFLKRAVVTTAGFAVLPNGSSDAIPARIDTVVIGAGLAGLAAAYELKKSRKTVVVLEARDRPGGRIETIRNFSSSLFAEAGAMYCNDSNTNLLRYSRELNVELVPKSISTSNLYYLKGRRIISKQDEVPDWPLQLSNEERGLNLSQLWNRYIRFPIAQLGDPDVWTNEIMQRLDAITMFRFLQEQGASDGVISLLRLGYLDVYGDGIETVCALQLIKILAKEQNQTSVYTLKGGSDQLPRALAKNLRDSVFYSSVVMRLHDKPNEVIVDYQNNGVMRRVIADYVVVAVPLTTLESIQVFPGLSQEKTSIIRSLKYTSITRTFLESSVRYWEPEGTDGSATVDLPIMRVLQHTVGTEEKGGILEAFLSGAKARMVCSMPEKAKMEFVLPNMERVYPGVTKHLVRFVSKCWDNDPWARGAFCWFKPGEMLRFMADIAKPEGRLHFAGEHTSWRTATMEGAIESGIRAANEILKRVSVGSH